MKGSRILAKWIKLQPVILGLSGVPVYILPVSLCYSSLLMAWKKNKMIQIAGPLSPKWGIATSQFTQGKKSKNTPKVFQFKEYFKICALCLD